MIHCAARTAHETVRMAFHPLTGNATDYETCSRVSAMAGLHCRARTAGTYRDVGSWRAARDLAVHGVAMSPAGLVRSQR
jgi:hypothetical protein